MTSRRADALTLLLLAAAAAAVLAGLGRIPALTSDEAWLGLYAWRLRLQGFVTPHEMNFYTGPLYGLLVSKVLAGRGVSVSSLRLFGAAANVAAFALLADDLRRRVDSQAAAWFSAALAGSAYLLLKSRLAWEVYALQPLFLALTIRCLDRPVTPLRAFAFCAVTLVGVQNHFIYLSVPASLCVLFFLTGDGPWLRLSISALAAGAVVFLVKPRLSESAWAAERLWAVPLFLALPALAAAAAVSRRRWDLPLFRLREDPLWQRWIFRAFSAGLLAFFIWHGVPLWRILAGPLVLERIFSWIAPGWLQVPLALWSAWMLALLIWRAVRAWHGQKPMSAHERTLALWPATYAAIFIAFRNTSSLRYYSPVQFLCLAALGPALARLPRPDRRWAAVLAAVSIFSTQFIFWRELAAPADRRPLSFKIGWHSDNSWDFARKDALFAAFDRSGACRAAHQERSFVAIPLDFHRLETGPLPCDPAKSFDADVCRDCTAPPFYLWSVVSSPR